MSLDSIFSQNYPHNLIEIIFIDAGSTDGTVEAINRYIKKYDDINIKVYENPLRTAEAGKAVGVRKAKNELVALIDSDNIMPDNNWISMLTEPFLEECIVASEPIEYTYRKEDSVINRYCSLIGMNDPICIFTGNYDRKNYITNKWTEVKREEIDKGNYLSIKFYDMIPTIGANGFVMRRESIIDNFSGDYLFDIDVLWEIFNKNSDLRVAKVKTGIIHLFCPDVKTFVRKQTRRIRDYKYFSSLKGRIYPWNKVGKAKLFKFVIYSILIIPLLAQAVIGYSRKHDLKAWLFHPVACWITLWVYGTGTIIGLFKKEMISREGWKQ